MRLYGKDSLKSRLDAAAAGGRLSHAILLHGERGSGRRVMAGYIAKLFLCGAPPCDNCAVCSRIDARTHPDVIFVKSACGGKYSMDALRRVLESTAVKPNDGDIKVYIFDDCDEMQPKHQNTLLKLIEEPARFLRFVFTCENVNSVIETVLSRVTAFEVPSASEEECAACLAESGVERKRASELSALFAGNIGRCMQVLSDDAETKLMDCAKAAAAGIARKNGYAAAAALSSKTDRGEFAAVLGFLTGILRDAMVLRCGGTASSCGRKEAADIAAAYSEAEIERMLESVFEVSSHEQLNLNLALTAMYLTSKML